MNYVAVAAGRNTLRRARARSGGDGRTQRGCVARPLRHPRRRRRRLDHRALGRRAHARARRARRTQPLTRTRLLVLDTRTLGVRKRIALPEFVSVDAISPDGRRSTCCAIRRRAGGLDYDVMALDPRRAAARRADHGPARARRADGRHPDPRTMSPDGRWAYTLYTGERELRPRAGHAEGRGALHRPPGRRPLRPRRSTLDGDRRCASASLATIDLRTFELVKAAATATTRADRDARARRRQAAAGSRGCRSRSGSPCSAAWRCSLTGCAHTPEPLEVTLTPPTPTSEKATR